MNNYVTEMKGFLSEFAPLENEHIEVSQEESLVPTKTYLQLNDEIIVKEMTTSNVSDVVDEIVMKAGWTEPVKQAVAKPLGWLGQKVGAASTRITNYATAHPVRAGAMAAGIGAAGIAAPAAGMALQQKLSEDRLKRQQEELERQQAAQQRRQVQMQEQQERNMIGAERKNALINTG
jgi:hypothetical protein